MGCISDIISQDRGSGSRNKDNTGSQYGRASRDQAQGISRIRTDASYCGDFLSLDLYRSMSHRCRSHDTLNSEIKLPRLDHIYIHYTLCSCEILHLRSSFQSGRTVTLTAFRLARCEDFVFSSDSPHLKCYLSSTILSPSFGRFLSVLQSDLIP